ncbi:stage II sporulation protein P [Proteinivorax hydrogeniformans]|uniref:Stage II sporulation protein P n=1 Tax=Proteinivorax hydrogeniformans TaxID=1826727 RepID=A0AAU8HWS9_9FIRM
MLKRMGTTFVVIALLLTFPAITTEKTNVAQAENIIEDFFDLVSQTELKDGQYFTMYGPEDEIIMKTARIIHVDDRFICSDNKLYEVYHVDNNELRADAKFVKEVALRRFENETNETNLLASIISKFSFTSSPAQAEDEGQGPVAIYHTHSDESYVPTDGTESIDEDGGIFDVGMRFRDELEDRGYDVVFSDQAHDPHDSGAYKRSRRTVEELLKENPAVLFDVHRDAVPAEQYAGEADGEDVAQIMLVVGQQNQNMAETEAFAEALKAKGDELHPDLMKGIFMANGSYNQDLSPRAVLLEVGTYTQEKELAKKGITAFTDVVEQEIYNGQAQNGDDNGQAGILADPGAGGNGGAGAGGGLGTAGRSILWILGIAAVGGIAFLVINSGGFSEVGSKLKSFTTKEFANQLKKQKDEEDDGEDK